MNMLVETKIFPNSLKLVISREDEKTETLNIPTESFSEFSVEENIEGTITYVQNYLNYDFTIEEEKEIIDAIRTDIIIITDRRA